MKRDLQLPWLAARSSEDRRAVEVFILVDQLCRQLGHQVKTETRALPVTAFEYCGRCHRLLRRVHL